MEKDVIISITDELYHLTILFPKKEPLKYKMREQANNILEYFVYYFKEKRNNFADKNALREMVKQAQKNLEAMDTYFEIVKRQNWISPVKTLLLRGRYFELRRLLDEIDLSDENREIKQEKNIPEPEAVEEVITATSPMPFKNKSIETMPAQSEEPAKMNDRQKIIVSILKNKEKGQVWEFKASFPDVSKRTLRRDFEYLYNQGVVKRVGEKNNTFYQLSR